MDYRSLLEILMVRFLRHVQQSWCFQVLTKITGIGNFGKQFLTCSAECTSDISNSTAIIRFFLETRERVQLVSFHKFIIAL